MWSSSYPLSFDFSDNDLRAGFSSLLPFLIHFQIFHLLNIDGLLVSFHTLIKYFQSPLVDQRILIIDFLMSQDVDTHLLIIVKLVIKLLKQRPRRDRRLRLVEVHILPICPVPVGPYVALRLRCELRSVHPLIHIELQLVDLLRRNQLLNLNMGIVRKIVPCIATGCRFIQLLWMVSLRTILILTLILIITLLGPLLRRLIILIGYFGLHRIGDVRPHAHHLVKLSLVPFDHLLLSEVFET